MTTFVDVQLIEGLGLPYAPGAEAGLLDSNLDPGFNDAWQALVAIFPELTLVPFFDELSVDELVDLVDGIRVNGDEPPNPFVWFTLACDASVVGAVVAAVQALPMVVFARERTQVFLAGSISYGTNPLTSETLQIQPAPRGVDAIYAWQVAGGAGDRVRVADIENGWLLGHDELLTANVRKLSVFGSSDVDHGTAVAGIVVGADNGVGTIGIVPNAELNLVTVNRGSGETDLRALARAITRAMKDLESGDVLLIEVGVPFHEGSHIGEVLAEFHPAVQVAIGLATKRLITVIEPAGNGGINLDDFPFLAHTRPNSPTFSGAIVVGAGEATLPLPNPWSRTFSSFGSRVDCFAMGSNIRAPSSVDHDSYQVSPQFTGTSGASAILAGAAASLQAMTRAASSGATLAPADVRRLFRSALLGTLPADPLGAKIGVMPDLRKIARAQGLVRVLPVGAAAIGGDALLMVHLDADNRLVRRHFTPLTGWGQPIPSPIPNDLVDPTQSPSPNDLFELTAAQPAVTSSDEIDPFPRLVFDAFFSGRGGIHHIFWDDRRQVGDVTTPVAPVTAAAQGRALAAVRPLLTRVVIAAISPEGRLVVITGDPDVLHAGMSTPLVLDAVGRYRRVAGPTIVSRGAGLVDVVVIEDGGSLRWFSGRLPAIADTDWSDPVTEFSVELDPGARPGLLVLGGLLLVAAVGSDGSLRVASIDPEARTIHVPVEVDFRVAIDGSGPVALGLTAMNVVALAVDTQGTLRAATRLIAGGSWTPLLPVLSPIAISPLGGVTAVTIDIGVMAIVVGVDGVVHSSLSLDGLLWLPLLPLPTPMSSQVAAPLPELEGIVDVDEQLEIMVRPNRKWNFTRGDFKSVTELAGLQLRFSPTTVWLPDGIKSRLLTVFNTLLNPATVPAATWGVSPCDWFHCHLGLWSGVPNVPVSAASMAWRDAAAEMSQALDAVRDRFTERVIVEGHVTSSGIIPADKVPLYRPVYAARLAQPDVWQLLSSYLLLPEAVIVHHTFEIEARRPLMPSDAERRHWMITASEQVVTSPYRDAGLHGDLMPAQNRGEFCCENTIQLNFLIDKFGVIHPVLGSYRDLAVVTGLSSDPLCQ